MSLSSVSVGFCPSDRSTVPSSFAVILPSPSLSNIWKASRNSGKDLLKQIFKTGLIFNDNDREDCDDDNNAAAADDDDDDDEDDVDDDKNEIPQSKNFKQKEESINT
ncbi:calmodulin [Elysia marginata]|uniref:Calmodulin n=1 Tax=Elysia marginata TaxID=1093978 RepID=A0AAV4GF11_9GAST|nr:calmodulin [Elysia marginata]